MCDARKLPFAAAPSALAQAATVTSDEDKGGTVQMIVDSGTALIYLPDSIAITVNSLFDPLATFDAVTGLYVVNCSAVAPKFGVCWRPVFLYQPAGYDAGHRTG